MDQRLARPGEGGDQGFDRLPVVAAGSIDGGVGAPGFAGQQGRIVERAQYRLDPGAAHRIAFRRIAHQPADGVAGLSQLGRNRSADEAACARHEDLHALPPCLRVIGGAGALVLPGHAWRVPRIGLPSMVERGLVFALTIDDSKLR